MGIIKLLNDMIEEGIEINNPDELSEYFEAKGIPHYYCWNSMCVPWGIDSTKKETPKLVFSIENGDDIKSRVKLIVSR